MIAARRLQRNFADGLIAEAVADLWEPWMRHADQALEDEALLLIIQRELAKRCKKSKTRGRPATSAEVVLRMMLLKHIRDWSLTVWPTLCAIGSCMPDKSRCMFSESKNLLRRNQT